MKKSLAVEECLMVVVEILVEECLLVVEERLLAAVEILVEGHLSQENLVIEEHL